MFINFIDEKLYKCLYLSSRDKTRELVIVTQPVAEKTHNSDVDVNCNLPTPALKRKLYISQ